MITSRHRQLLKDAYQEIENQKHKIEKPMTNQQKQLQSILAEVGINLTKNQTLAVIEANELLRCNEPSYSQVMEFKEKYAPKREKQDGIYIRQIDKECLENPIDMSIWHKDDSKTNMRISPIV